MQKICFVRWGPIIGELLQFFFILLMLFCASKLYSPLMYRFRAYTPLFFLISFALAILNTRCMTKSFGREGLTRWHCRLFISGSLLVVFMLTHNIAVFQYKKHVVLNMSGSLLRKLGSHFIVGYQEVEDITQLIEKGAVGGIYITHRNVDGKSFEAVKLELNTFQSIAVENGLSPLFVAADQEGGIVSRLDHILRSQPSLASIADEFSTRDSIRRKVKNYAASQAVQLASLGVNLNLSPVVDLKTNGFKHYLNFYTRLDKRAISDNVNRVIDVADAYCTTLTEYGVRPTLKHFPGLGGVTEDTHWDEGALNFSREYLEQNDWRPFREVGIRTESFIMLGHVSLSSVDPDLPVSLSSKVINDVIRKGWAFEGVLITDDFNMGAIAGRREGIAGSAVRALNAGVDLILLSYDGSQYYPAMYALLKAYRRGEINPEILEQSRRRLSAFKPETSLREIR